MKKLLLFILVLSMYNFQAQVAINNSGSAPDPSAMLDIQSTDSGLLIPRMTASDRDNIASPATGLTVYVTDDNSFYYYDGTSWVNLSTQPDDDWKVDGNNMYSLPSGNVGIGTSNPQEKLEINGNIRGNQQGGALRIKTDYGVLDIGPKNGGFAHFYTNRPRFYFNKKLVVNEGIISSYDEDLKLQTQYHTHLTILNSNGNVGIDTETPQEKLEINGSIRGDQNGALKINTDNGYVVVGPVNSGWSHFLTDRSKFYFNKRVYVNEGIISSYDEDLNLQTQGTTRMTILKSNGNVGIGTNAPDSKLEIIENLAGKPVTKSTNNNTDTANSYGIHGITNEGSTRFSSGVFGESATFGSHEIGVLGDYTGWGVGVAGLGYGITYDDIPYNGTNTLDIGVFGGADFASSIGVYGLNKSNSGTAYAGYFDGDHAITGTKSASVPTTQGNQLLYSMESPEIWFEDLGVGELHNGKTHIKLDKMFNQTVFIDSNHPMHVFLQEQGECNGLYFIPDSDGKGFTVKEKANGHSNIKFSYRIVAKRRFYQDHRFGIDPMQPLKNNLKNAEYHKPRITKINKMRRLLQSQKK